MGLVSKFSSKQRLLRVVGASKAEGGTSTKGHAAIETTRKPFMCLHVMAYLYGSCAQRWHGQLGQAMFDCHVNDALFLQPTSPACLCMSHTATDRA
jgi:hypothetical protein